MQLALRVLSTLVVLLLASVALWLALNPRNSAANLKTASSAPEPPPAWTPPGWLPETRYLHAFFDTVPDPRARLRGRRAPRVRSTSAFVFDIDAGRILYEKNADRIQPVASLTKLVSALALVSADPDLERQICIDAEHYPTRSGARSRMWTDDCLQGWDVLGAALVASDNRAAHALATVAGMSVDRFIERMNRVSAELEMTRSTWTDPSGLEDDNLSTARDVARATLAVAGHPVLGPVASAPHWDVHYRDRPMRRLYTTNRFVAREDLVFEAAKTGYTDTALYCLSTVLTTRSGHHLAVTTLGAWGRLTRWADLNRILRWVDHNAPE